MSNNKSNLVVFCVLSVLCFIIFRDYLDLKYAYYFWDISGDGYYYSYPSLCGYADYLHSHGIPAWSFKAGMGQNIFPFILRDPFDIILYIAGSSKIVYLTIYVEVLKIILAGMIFYNYLRLLNLSFFSALTGCVLFSFSGFMLEGSAWFIFSFEAFNFALLLLGFELLFLKDKWPVFFTGIFLLCISMPFNLYLYGLFMLFYTIFRHLHTGRFDGIKLFRLSGRLAILTIAAILLSGPLLLQNVSLLLHSPRGAMSAQFGNEFRHIPFLQLSDPLQIGTAILRFFSTDILGSGSNFKGWDTILGAPLFYCGLICLIVAPQVFGSLNKRQRILFIASLILWLLPAVFPYLRSALWLFSGVYYRGYSLFVAFLLIYFTAHALDHIIRQKKVNYTTLAVSLSVLLLLLAFTPFIDKNTIDRKIQAFAACMLIAYTVVLALLPAIKKINIARASIFALVAVEIICMGYITANRRDAFLMNWLQHEKVLYNSYSLDAIKYIQSIDRSFYRVDKNFDPPTARYTDLNASQRQGYNSTSSYNSFNQLYYISYLQFMGIAGKTSEADSRWAIGLIDNPMAESQNRVKYFLSVKNYHPQWPEMWDSLTTTGDVTIFKNKFVLPFGYACSSYISDSSLSGTSGKQRQLLSINTLIVQNKDVPALNKLTRFQINDTVNTPPDFEHFKEAAIMPDRDTLTISRFEDNLISGTISLKKDKLMYLSIPFDDGWHIFVDGQEKEKLIINGGMTGIYLDSGNHDIKIRYKLSHMVLGSVMSIIGALLVLLLAGLRRKVKAPTLPHP